MVVHEPAGLHESVADGRPHKAKAALLQIPAHRVRLRGGGRNVSQRPPPAARRLAAYESPDIAVERAELLLYAQQRLRVRDGRLDLEAVAHDAFVLEQLAALRLAERGDLAGIESGEGSPVGLSLAQDGAPGEAGLGPLEDEELEEHTVVVHWPAPLFVVVPDHRRVRAGPPATCHDSKSNVVVAAQRVREPRSYRAGTSRSARSPPPRTGRRPEAAIRPSSSVALATSMVMSAGSIRSRSGVYAPSRQIQPW